MEEEQLREELTRIVITTWDMVAHMPVEVIDQIPDSQKNTLTYLSSVHINGDWLGSVSLECNREHAVNVARNIFELGESEVSSTMIGEAMRELANMTGGNLKSLLGTHCVMSVPKMIETVGYNHRQLETNEVTILNFKVGSDYLSAKAFHSIIDPLVLE